jgi:serine/threonine protein kinase
LRGAEFVSSSPAPQSSRIRRESFSPNYFNTFFIEERELGRGGKGVVLLVRHEIDGCNLGHFACKRVPVGDDHAWLEKVLVEVELLAKLSHPNLVSYRHVWLEDVHLNRFGPSVVCAFILQQYCNSGDLLNYVIGGMPKEATKEELKAQMRRRSKGQAERPQLQKRLTPEEIYSLFKDITSGLAYLHAANYIHRDLKPSNCLLHRDGTRLKCLISDFGEVQAENVVRKSTGSTGTISYCAPEVLKRDASGRYGNFTTKSDVFSLGMILYFMCFGRLPYINANTVHEELEDIDQLRAEISDWKGFQDERKERPDLPSKLYQLLKRLLSVNPAERPTANEVLYAMRGESPLDGVRRGSRSTSPPIGLGLAGQRIQNLDSPMPPSTPLPGSSSPPLTHSHRETHPATDPTKHARVTASPDIDLPNSYGSHSPETTATAHSTSTSALLTKRISPPSPTSPLHPRSHAMAISRSNHSHNHTTSRGRGRGLSRSPERATSTPGTPTTADIPTITITTPLLMAPPTTGLARVRQGAALRSYQAAQWVSAHTALLRLVVFVGKMVSLSWVCWPYSAGWMVMGVVVLLAVGDLEGAVWDSGTGEGGEAQEGEGGMGWLGRWWRSVGLLVMHCVVLGVTARFGGLCAAPAMVREGLEWEEW